MGMEIGDPLDNQLGAPLLTGVLPKIPKVMVVLKDAKGKPSSFDRIGRPPSYHLSGNP